MLTDYNLVLVIILNSPYWNRDLYDIFNWFWKIPVIKYELISGNSDFEKYYFVTFINCGETLS